MRIDKFLWCIRIFKTRSLATEACKKGQIQIGGVKVKPSKEVFGKEKIQVRKNQINYIYDILDIPPSRVGAKLLDQYRKDCTPKEAFATNELLKLAKDYYRKKGVGRPTKKDRRAIEGYTTSPDEDAAT